MKSVKALCWLSILLTFGGSMRAGDDGFRGRLPSGPFTPGFRLMEVPDASRSFPGGPAGVVISRPLRIYMWYPANGSTQPRLRLDDYARMAVGDFSPAGLPVPLVKGFEAGRREALLSAPTEAVRDAEAAPGRFPLLILGQGLFYESPLSHFVLCEFLASHGYVVATSPLLGTQYRLVNLNVADLETGVRDMEFVLAQAYPSGLYPAWEPPGSWQPGRSP